MDIFPTNLIDNIIAHKNFSAELPADFTGGLVNIETKAFPEKKMFRVSADIGYNPQMHLNSNYLTYKGGNTDFLGFDDGTRALPKGTDPVNIPTPVNGASKDEVNQFVRSFNPELGVSRATSPVDYGASLTLGDQYQLNSEKKNSLGYILSLSYKRSYTYYDDVTYSEYQRYSDSSVNDLRYATIQKGEVSEDMTLLGGLAGLAYKTQKSKYRLTAMRLQSGTKRAGRFNIDNDGQAVGQSGYKAVSDNLEYNQRSLTNVLLAGDHALGGDKWQIDWKLSPTWSTSDDPDIRKTAFTVTNPNEPTFLAGAGGNPSRIWRYLDEMSATAKIDLVRNYKLMERPAALKFGGSHIYKQRDYEILFFDVQFLGSQSWSSADVSQVLNPANIYPNKPNSIYYQTGNLALNPNAYSSNVNNSAFYVSNEMSLLPQLKSVLGVRAENYVQRYTGADQKYANGDTVNGSCLQNDEVLSALDWFPSANLIYALREKQNLRLAYGRTIARPSFKELSFAQILDPITNRIFNGSLFTYPDWDGKLTSTRINNFDIRWEMFMERSELISVSGFYKTFDDAIELVRIPTQQTSTEFQARNVGNGKVYGAEFEIRKELGFISPFFSDLLFSGNVTFVKSQIQMTDLEYNSRKGYERSGQNIINTRDMAGQSPYVINTGLSYSNQKNGLNAGVFYNVKGPTLYIVGVGLYPDVYTEPFHSLNLSVNKTIGREGKTIIDFKVANLLNDRVEKFYRSYNAGEEIFDSINPGVSLSLGVSHNF
jgi:TonB-dependent receptor